MPNIIGGKINFFYYGDVGRGRLSGTLQNGEVDMTALLTSARINAIYAANTSSGFKSFSPSSQFNSLLTLEVGEGYFIDAKIDFDMPGVLPKPIASEQATALDFLQQGAPGQWIDRTNPIANGIKLFYSGEQNRDVVNDVSGVLKKEGGTPVFEYLTLEAGRAIQGATQDEYITVTVPSIAGNYTDFTIMFSGRIVEGTNIANMVGLNQSAGVRAIRFGGSLGTTDGSLGDLVAAIRDGASVNQNIVVPSQYIKNTYSTYVLRRLGTSIKLFRNGLEVGSAAITNGSITLNGEVIIGRSIDGVSIDKAKLQTAMIAFYSIGLSDLQIASLHANPFIAYKDLADITPSSPSPTPTPTPSPGSSTSLRVYAVHNSVYDSAGAYAGSLQPAVAAKGKQYIRGRHMIPGAPLSFLWENPDSPFADPGQYPQALAQSWDRLILQPFDRGLTGSDGDITMSKNFMNLAIASNAAIDTYIYSRWMRTSNAPGQNYQSAWLGSGNESKGFFESLVQQLRVEYPTRTNKIWMIPAGDIMYDLDIKMRAGQISGYTNIFQIYADGIHLNDVGQYIAGCGVYATLYKDSPVGFPTTAYNFSDQTLGNTLAASVWQTVNNHPYSGVSV